MVPDNKFGLFLGLSIAEIICCSPICGIISLIFIIMANNAYKDGNYEDYTAKEKVCKIALIVGLVLAVITIISSFASGMFTAFLDY